MPNEPVLVSGAAAKPATTEFANKDAKTMQVGSAAPAAAQQQDAAQQVSVKALRTFHEQENMQGKVLQPGDTFQTSRDRAAQLRANGLIEYTDASLETQLHGEAGAKQLQDRAAIDQASRELPKNSKTTPLKNPKLNY